jgi:CENP-S associating Centromere protein X
MSSEDDPTTYPTKVIGRILQETFESPNTRISPDALTVVTEYLRIYTREAIWRASQEKSRNDTVAGTLGTGLLEVEDLEKITGPLTLDFS